MITAQKIFTSTTLLNASCLSEDVSYYNLVGSISTSMQKEFFMKESWNEKDTSHKNR